MIMSHQNCSDTCCHRTASCFNIKGCHVSDSRSLSPCARFDRAVAVALERRHKSLTNKRFMMSHNLCAPILEICTIVGSNIIYYKDASNNCRKHTKKKKRHTLRVQAFPLELGKIQFLGLYSGLTDL